MSDTPKIQASTAESVEQYMQAYAMQIHEADKSGKIDAADALRYMLKSEQSQGKKFDSHKPDMSLLSSIALFKVAEVMTFGKQKYSANNWRKGLAYTRLAAAALRHIFSWLGGESLDPETGCSHLAHASCCLMMLLEFETTRQDLDDRYKPEAP